MRSLLSYLLVGAAAGALAAPFLPAPTIPAWATIPSVLALAGGVAWSSRRRGGPPTDAVPALVRSATVEPLDAGGATRQIVDPLPDGLEEYLIEILRPGPAHGAAMRLEAVAERVAKGDRPWERKATALPDPVAGPHAFASTRVIAAYDAFLREVDPLAEARLRWVKGVDPRMFDAMSNLRRIVPLPGGAAVLFHWRAETRAGFALTRPVMPSGIHPPPADEPRDDGVDPFLDHSEELRDAPPRAPSEPDGGTGDAGGWSHAPAVAVAAGVSILVPALAPVAVVSALAETTARWGRRGAGAGTETRVGATLYLGDREARLASMTQAFMQAAAAGWGGILCSTEIDPAQIGAWVRRSGRSGDLVVLSGDDLVSAEDALDLSCEVPSGALADRIVASRLRGAGADPDTTRHLLAYALSNLSRPFELLDDLMDETDLQTIVTVAAGSARDDACAVRARHYLETLPGFHPDRGYRQAVDVVERHLSAVAAIGGMFADHMFPEASLLAERPTIDLREVVEGQRLLVVIGDPEGETAGLLSRLVVDRLLDRRGPPRRFVVALDCEFPRTSLPSPTSLVRLDRTRHPIHLGMPSPRMLATYDEGRRLRFDRAVLSFPESMMADALAHDLRLVDPPAPEVVPSASEDTIVVVGDGMGRTLPIHRFDEATYEPTSKVLPEEEA